MSSGWDPTRYKPRWSFRPSGPVVLSCLSGVALGVASTTTWAEWHGHLSFALAKTLAFVVAMALVAPKVPAGRQERGFPTGPDADDDSGTIEALDGRPFERPDLPPTPPAGPGPSR